MSEENLQLFRGGLAAWNAGDYEAAWERCSLPPLAIAGSSTCAPMCGVKTKEAFIS
jgi:hypothetical protein